MFLYNKTNRKNVKNIVTYIYSDKIKLQHSLSCILVRVNQAAKFVTMCGYIIVWQEQAAAKTTTTSETDSLSAAAADYKIIVPKRIHRSPTDILIALSATIGLDPTGPHYKYHDDPFLIPTSNASKRTFAMAQESGRKAAKWIKEEHGQWFQHNEAAPPIKAFQPKPIYYTEDSEVDALSLQQTIENGEITDSMLVYKLLQKRSIEVPMELQQNLLELICFYNHDEPLDDDFIEERWFRQSSGNYRGRQRQSWKDGQLAEQIFNNLDEKDSRAYDALIRGMCKYLQCERSYALYQEALDKNLINNVETFNAIISIVNLLKESGEMRWKLIQEILQTMKALKIKPNLNTLNACLSVVSTIAGGFSRSFTLKLLSEFKNNLNIEPSLTTWYYVLISFCRDRGPVSHVLNDIINEIDGKEFQIQNIKDTYFFVSAMDVARNHLNNRQLAQRIDNLLHLGNNYDLIGDSYKESVYYRHYFAVMCSTAESFDEFMDLYNKYVPNIYVPEPGIMSEILTSLELNGAIQYLPQLWSNMIIFDHINRETLLSQILKIMVENEPNKDIENQMNLTNEYTKIAWDIWGKYTEEPQMERRTSQQLTWSGQIFGYILTLCCRSQDFEKALQIFIKLDKEQHKIVGTPDQQQLKLYIQLCIDQKLPSRAIDCLQYAVGNGFSECKEFARHIAKSMTLDEYHINKIKNLVDPNVFNDL